MPSSPNRSRGPGPGARLAIVLAGALVVAAVASVLAGAWEADRPAAGSAPARVVESATRDERAAPAAARESDVALVDRPTALRARPSATARRLARIEKTTRPWGSPTVLAVLDRRGDWLRVMAAELPNGRSGWIAAGDVQVFPIDYRIRIDLSARRIDVVRAGRVVRRIRAAVGEQGTPTPKGDFAVTDKIPFVDRGSPYGCCAIALTAHQPRTPRGWTGGDRIAIHATPASSSVGRPVTAGCMRVADADARWLLTRLPLGTQVSIRA